MWRSPVVRRGVAVAASVALLVGGCVMPTRDHAIVTAARQDYTVRQVATMARAADQPMMARHAAGRRSAVPLLAFFGEPTTQPAEAAASSDGTAVAARPGGVPEGYWRADVWHQMGRESLNLVERDLWRGFVSTYGRVENIAILALTMGASVTIQSTGVDQAVRRRTEGSRQLGDADEPIQLLGHPGTHFAAAGVLWLTSALTQDEKTHEFSRSLGQALVVNGLSTIALKVAANRGAPNGDEYAWPSGHTSSAFTTAAVVNEYYGPLAGVPAFALAGLVGYQRIDSRVHDFSDVIFGAVLGYVVGSSIARDNKLEYPELFGMQVMPYADPQTGATGIALFKTY